MWPLSCPRGTCPRQGSWASAYVFCMYTTTGPGFTHGSLVLGLHLVLRKSPDDIGALAAQTELNTPAHKPPIVLSSYAYSLNNLALLWHCWSIECVGRAVQCSTETRRGVCGALPGFWTNHMVLPNLNFSVCRRSEGGMENNIQAALWPWGLRSKTGFLMFPGLGALSIPCTVHQHCTWGPLTTHPGTGTVPVFWKEHSAISNSSRLCSQARSPVARPQARNWADAQPYTAEFDQPLKGYFPSIILWEIS